MLINRTTKLTSAIKEHADRKALLLQSFSAFQDVESSTRAYIVLGNSFFITARVESLQRLKLSVSELKFELRDNKQQWNRFIELEKIYNSRLDLLNKVMQSGDKALRKRIVESSTSVVNTARTLVNSMLDWEDIEINKHNRKLKENIERTPGTMLVVTVLFIAFSLVLYLYLSKQFRKGKYLQSGLKEAFLKTEEQKKFAYMVFNSIPVLLITLDMSFTITFANEAFKIHTGTDDSIIGKDYRKLFGFYDEYAQAVFRGEEITINQFLAANNKYYNLLVIPIKNSNDEVDGIIIISNDVDAEVRSRIENVETMQQLRKTNEQLRNFTFVASHDLQEPLRKIRTFASKVLSQKLTPRTAREDLEKIREAATRMSELLDSIVRFSSLEMSELHIELVDLNRIMNQTLTDLEIQISEKNADIQYNPLPTIYCDPIQIRQLFFHLISNALKFSESRPVIEVESTLLEKLPADLELDDRNPYYKISFTDNGIGFNREYTQKMFMLFHKLHHHQEYSGTGIGLAMSKKIAENHKGTIVAQPRANGGAVFDVYLPANPENKSQSR